MIWVDVKEQGDLDNLRPLHLVYTQIMSGQINQRHKLRVATLTILVIVVVQILGCKPSQPFSYLQISGEIVLDSNEQRLVFAEPFKPSKQSNIVCFRYSEPLKVEYVDKPPKFPDGKPLLITAKLTDETGKIILLNNISRNGPDYLCLTPEEYKWWITTYKTDIQFTELSVQSNRTIKISKIEWEMHNAWDLK